MWGGDRVTLSGAGRNGGGWSPHIQTVPITGTVRGGVATQLAVGASQHPPEAFVEIDYGTI